MDVRFQSLSQEDLKTVDEMRLWLNNKLEDEFVKELKKSDQEMLTGIGSPATVLGICTLDPSKNHYDAIIDAMKELKPVSK